MCHVIYVISTTRTNINMHISTYTTRMHWNDGPLSRGPRGIKSPLGFCVPGPRTFKGLPGPGPLYFGRA